MRRCLCAVLLSCILAVGSLAAGELTTAQAQQLVSAAQGIEAGGKAEVTMTVDGKSVAFTVTRDAVGNVTARPVPGPDSAGITISQVTIQLRANDKGILSPTTLVVVSSAQTIASYSVQLNPDGTIASLYQAGIGGAGGTGAPAKAKPVVGGIGGGSGSLSGTPSDLPQDRFPGFTSGQLGLPAGTGTGQASGSVP
jgi:hypothetical protein